MPPRAPTPRLGQDGMAEAGVADDYEEGDAQEETLQGTMWVARCPGCCAAWGHHQPAEHASSHASSSRVPYPCLCLG